MPTTTGENSILGMAVARASARAHAPLILNGMYRNEVLRDGPFLYLPLSEAEGPARDLSGGERHGEYLNAPHRAQEGAFPGSRAVRSTVRDSVVRVLRHHFNGPLVTARSPSSVSFWVRVENFNSTHEIARGGSTISITTSGRLVATGSGTPFDVPFGPAGAWKHVAVLSDGFAQDVYINGEHVGSGAAVFLPTPYSSSGSTNHLILANPLTTSSGRSISLDEFAVFNYVLSLEQVLRHYQAGTDVVGWHGGPEYPLRDVARASAHLPWPDVEGTLEPIILAETGRASGSAQSPRMLVGDRALVSWLELVLPAKPPDRTRFIIAPPGRAAATLRDPALVRATRFPLLEPELLTATASAFEPQVVLSRALEISTATASAEALVPEVEVTDGAYLQVPSSAAVADAPAPVVSTMAVLEPPVVQAAAGALEPALAMGATASAPPAGAEASALEPDVATEWSPTLVVPVSSATARARIPAIVVGIEDIVTPPQFRAEADMRAPSLVVEVRLAADVATATADLLDPEGLQGVGSILSSPSAEAEAEMQAPEVSISLVRDPGAAEAVAGALAPEFGQGPTISVDAAAAEADLLEPGVLGAVGAFIDVPVATAEASAQEPNRGVGTGVEASVSQASASMREPGLIWTGLGVLSPLMTAWARARLPNMTTTKNVRVAPAPMRASALIPEVVLYWQQDTSIELPIFYAEATAHPPVFSFEINWDEIDAEVLLVSTHVESMMMPGVEEDVRLGSTEATVVLAP